MDKRYNEYEIEKRRKMVEDWDKPLRPPVAVPKPSSMKKKRGPKPKEEAE